MLKRIILPTFLLLSTVVRQGEAFETEIQASPICRDTSFQDCYLNGRTCEVLDGEEQCGPCQPGYIEYIEYSEADKAQCIHIDDMTWKLYAENYEPFYADDEEVDKRILLLRDSAKFISETNANNQDFSLGFTPFSADQSIDYKTRSGYFHVDSSGTQDQLPIFVPPTVANADVLTTFDWVAEGAVTPVTDQGRCASSWAISVCGAIEGAAYKSGKPVESLSFQQLLSCNKRNLGCGGGSTLIAARYAIENWYGGVRTLEKYPFTDANGTTSEVCELKGDTPPPALNVTDALTVVGLDSSVTFDKRLQTFKLALMDKPISVILKSSCTLFSNYISGVLTDDADCACNDSSCYDHSVLMVGYDDMAETPYFRFKNSWGTKWGEEGYFRVSQQEVASGAYGLFGVYGEGIMVGVEQSLPPDSGDTDEFQFPLPIWAMVTIAVLASVCCFCVTYAACLCWSRRQR